MLSSYKVRGRSDNSLNQHGVSPSSHQTVSSDLLQQGCKNDGHQLLASFDVMSHMVKIYWKQTGWFICDGHTSEATLVPLDGALFIRVVGRWTHCQGQGTQRAGSTMAYTWRPGTHAQPHFALDHTRSRIWLVRPFESRGDPVCLHKILFANYSTTYLTSCSETTTMIYLTMIIQWTTHFFKCQIIQQSYGTHG